MRQIFEVKIFENDNRKECADVQYFASEELADKELRKLGFTKITVSWEKEGSFRGSGWVKQSPENFYSKGRTQVAYQYRIDVVEESDLVTPPEQKYFYQVTEDSAGVIILWVWENKNLIFAADANDLLKRIDLLKSGKTDPREWAGNIADTLDYDAICDDMPSTVVIADNSNIYHDNMGPAGRGIFGGRENFIDDTQSKIDIALESQKFLPMQSEVIRGTLETSRKLIENLSVEDLARVVQLLNAHWHKAVAWRNAEIEDEGCFWSESKQKCIEIK